VDERVEQPPPTVRADVERHFGADLTRVPVRRGHESATVARRLRARAFTAGGEVHVPADVGPLDRGPGRTLLRHELVHVVQQRRAPQVPVESSDQGRALEAEAQRLASEPGLEGERWPARRGVVLSEAGVPLGRPRIVEPAAPQPPAPPQAPPVQRAAEQPASGETPATEPSPDEMLDRLYEQFSSRLRGELLIDRERAGTLTDR